MKKKTTDGTESVGRIMLIIPHEGGSLHLSYCTGANIIWCEEMFLWNKKN